jgi:hypothetical protein
LRPKSWSESSGHCDGWRCLSRVPSIAAAARADTADLECTQPTTGAIDSHASQILVRVLSLIDAQFQSVVTTLFAGKQLLDLYHSDRLHWASREPTINVYYTPEESSFPTRTTRCGDASVVRGLASPLLPTHPPTHMRSSLPSLPQALTVITTYFSRRSLGHGWEQLGRRRLRGRRDRLLAARARDGAGSPG